jgi:dihydropteroate synthase
MTADAVVPMAWRTAGAAVRLDRPVVVGILNVTPDSFWDGGRHDSVEAAVRRAALLLEEGAGIVDVGGESTRPGATRVAPADEIGRVVPVIAAISRRWPDVPVSVDTTKAVVARAALEAGATIINDVSALRLDDELGAVVARAGAGLILMHSRGDIEHMARYDLADYTDDVTDDVARELTQAIERAHAHGVSDDAIVVDPGLGFAKRTEHSLALLARLQRITRLGRPVLVGASRKRFTGDVSGGLPAEERLEATLAACVVAFMNGARLFRVHDVRAARRALDLAAAVTEAARMVQGTP